MVPEVFREVSIPYSSGRCVRVKLKTMRIDSAIHGLGLNPLFVRAVFAGLNAKNHRKPIGRECLNPLFVRAVFAGELMRLEFASISPHGRRLNPLFVRAVFAGNGEMENERE